MQGDKIAETSGKVTSQRVLPNPGGGPKMESSFAASGKLLGVDETETGTYSASVRPDGTLYGEGDRKSTRLNSSHSQISYAVFCLKKKNNSGARITGRQALTEQGQVP